MRTITTGQQSQIARTYSTENVTTAAARDLSPEYDVVPNDLERLAERPDDEPEDVVFETLYGLRTIELNRPKKFNALNASMVRKIAPRLREWSRSDLANVVVIKGTGEKAFCAGGDVMSLAKQNQHGQNFKGVRRSTDFFALEYALDHYIATYNKPYVAYMDGITMGGGVGLSIHAPFRIATEKTVFAMPETGIGFFPDVGGTFFLNRLPGALGTYLGMTGELVHGINCFYTGIATHYLPSAQLPALSLRLAELRFHDYDSYETRCALVNQTINEYSVGIPWDQPGHKYGGFRRELIDEIFDPEKNTVADIIAGLKAVAARKEQNPKWAEWAEKTLARLAERAPTSLLVTREQMRLGRKLDIASAFAAEYELAARFMAGYDFTEGVLAQLSKPRRVAAYKPATLDEIMDHEAHIKKFMTVVPKAFSEEAKISAMPRLRLWKDTTFEQYPLNFGIPHEENVIAMVERLEAEKGDGTEVDVGEVIREAIRGARDGGVGGLQHPRFGTVIKDVVMRHRRRKVGSKDAYEIEGVEE